MDFVNLWQPIDAIACHLVGKRFVGAQSADDVLLVGEQLKRRGFKVTYNLLGEHIKDNKTIEAALGTTLALINKMNHDNCGNISCKPTLYGLAMSKKLFHESITAIAHLAYKKGVEVEFDAEEFKYIPDTFEVFSNFASNPYFKNTVRQAVQAHLKSIERLMDKYELWNKNLRIVKGGGVYKEQESVVSQNEFLVAERYMEILRRNLRNGREPFVATVRDRRLVFNALALADSMNGFVVVQTLFGPLSVGFRDVLIRKKCPVNVYIPFTDNWCRDAWKPYGMRRARMIRKIIWEETKRIISIGQTRPFLLPVFLLEEFNVGSSIKINSSSCYSCPLRFRILHPLHRLPERRPA